MAKKYPVSFSLTTRLDRRELARLKGKLARIEKELDRELEKLATAYAIAMVREARALAPKRTGNMASDIAGEVKRIVTRWVAEVKANATGKAPYSGYVEYGTSKMAARPYLRPVVEKHRALWLRDTQAIKRRLRSLR